MKRVDGIRLLSGLGALAVLTWTWGHAREPVEVLVLSPAPQPAPLPHFRAAPCQPRGPQSVQPASAQAPMTYSESMYPQSGEPELLKPAAPMQQVRYQPSANAAQLRLDTVLRLARDQNSQINLARHGLTEASAEQQAAGKRGLFDWRGRREQDAATPERIEVWRKQIDLAKLTSETLLDAGGTYVDLLAARISDAIVQETEQKLAELLVLAQTLARIDSGTRVEVIRIQSEIQGQKLLGLKFREGAWAASARLAYLLGLDSNSERAVPDQMVCFHLVDDRQAPERLVEQAHARGPGVREVEELLDLLEKAQTPSRRWNLADELSAAERRRVTQSKLQQARLAYQDLRAKLTLGVQEAVHACLSSREQMKMAEKQIACAEEAWKLSNTRLRENITGRSPSEVLLSIRALAAARLSYLLAIRDLDKAQLRLHVLTGGVSAD